jgi:hypothetical protein
LPRGRFRASVGDALIHLAIPKKKRVNNFFLHEKG